VLSNIDKALVIFIAMVTFHRAQSEHKAKELTSHSHQAEEYIGVLLALTGGMLYALCRARLHTVEARERTMIKSEDDVNRPRWRRLLTAVLEATIFARLDTWYYAETQGEHMRLLRRELKSKATMTYFLFEPLNRLFRGRGRQLSRATIVALSCTFCMSCSICMSLGNKYVVRAFNLSVTVTVFQMLFGTAILSMLSPLFHFGDWHDVRKWALVSLIWGFNLATSNIALQNASLGLVMITRNCSPIITFLFEAIFQEAILMSPPALMALIIMTSGVVLYTYNDVSLSAVGLASCFLDIFVGIAAALMQRRYIAVHPVDVSFGGMLLLQNTIGMFPDVILLFAIREPWSWDRIVHAVVPIGENVSLAELEAKGHVGHHWGDYAMFFLTCGLGLVMGWASINAQQYVTATTMMVMGNCNRILIIVGGAIVIGEQYTWIGVFGIALAISGSIWYGYTRTRVVYGNKKMKLLSYADNLDRLGSEGKSGLRRNLASSSQNSIAGESAFSEVDSEIFSGPRSPRAAAALAANQLASAGRGIASRPAADAEPSASVETSDNVDLSSTMPPRPTVTS